MPDEPAAKRRIPAGYTAWRVYRPSPGAGAAGAEVPVASLAAVNFPAKAFYLLSAVGICASSSEARRQIQGGGVKLDGDKLADPNQEFATADELDGKVLQLGKKTFRRLVAAAPAVPGVPLPGAQP
jgi:hypothetical protein